MKIAALINYCTNDYRFIKRVIDNIVPFTSQIIVPVCDHYFTGEEENRELLEKTYTENPSAQFIEYEWDSKHNTRYWSNMSRLIGAHQLNDDIDWILFLDADEVIDTEMFIDFLKNTPLNLMSYKFLGYYYFREPIYQAIQKEDCSVLCKREFVNTDVFHTYHERGQYSEILNVPKKENVIYNGLPMIHHYSWVRTKEQMLKKVQTWWHKDDRNWKELVEKEFSHPFDGTDFVHGYQYITVENKYNL